MGSGAIPVPAFTSPMRRRCCDRIDMWSELKFGSNFSLLGSFVLQSDAVFVWVSVDDIGVAGSKEAGAAEEATKWSSF